MFSLSIVTQFSVSILKHSSEPCMGLNVRPALNPLSVAVTQPL